MTSFSLLTNPPAPVYPEYAELRAAADTAWYAEGRFVDPRAPYQLEKIVGRRGSDWATAVLGRYYTGLRSLYSSDVHLLRIADERDLTPPLPDWILKGREEAARAEEAKQRRRQERRERDETAWRDARSQTSVEFEVRPNPTAHRYSGFAEQVCHAVPTADAYSGEGRRTRRHPADRALCETERRTTPLRLNDPVDAPVTCVRCLVWVPKVRSER